MKRSELKPMPDYFDRYINKTDDVALLEALEISLQELQQVPLQKWKALGDNVYAEGKWTLKQLLQHTIDTERVFAYRATAFARKDPQRMISFDEDLYANNAIVSHRKLEDVLEEAILLRKSTIALFKSFTEEMLQTIGKSFNSEYSVAAIGFVIAGHQRWHFNVLEERYYPLLEK
ncbi:MAG: DinB family protein [Chitinophagales bacterium]|jgi:uncharacterized protein YijF (DUF1287 family)